MPEPDRTRSTRLRKAQSAVQKINDEISRNDLAAEGVLTQIEAREERMAARNATTHSK